MAIIYRSIFSTQILVSKYQSLLRKMADSWTREHLVTSESKNMLKKPKSTMIHVCKKGQRNQLKDLQQGKLGGK